MTVWDELSLTLARLLKEQPGALAGYPDPRRSEAGPPPYTISLAPWAEAVADDLSRRFGQVTAGVVDPVTGEVVGGFSGWQTLPLIMFRIAPRGTERIPLLIGTASSTDRLGYAIPPGSWGLQATLDFARDPEEHVSRRTPVMPLTITA